MRLHPSGVPALLVALSLSAASPAIPAGGAAASGGGSGSATAALEASSDPVAPLGPPGDTAPPAPGARTLVAALNGFGWDLYRELAAEGGNVCVAPLAVAETLAMVHAGAAGGTRDELGRALGLPYGGDELAGAWRDLKRALPNPLVLEDTAAVFLVASLWHQRGIPLRRKYLEGEERTFGPSVFPAAFRGSVLGASKAMESWILRVTGVRMGGIVPYRPGPGTVMVLVSSLSFTGLWREAFPEDGIRRGFFRLGEERHVEVGFQRRAGMYRYMEDGAGQAVEIPYRRGRYTMTVLLGAGGGDGDLAALERDASPEALERRLRGLSWRHVELELPEFRLTGKSMSLKGPLEALGVKTAFTARADLSGMARPGELRISDVFHKVYVQVDEDGDTGPPDGGGAIAGSPPLPPASFRADRPFMFFIRDIVTDGFLAMGRVSDPRDR